MLLRPQQAWGGAFEHLHAVNFLCPGFVYIVRRAFGDFRAIAILQHLLGLAAGEQVFKLTRPIAKLLGAVEGQPQCAFVVSLLVVNESIGGYFERHSIKSAPTHTGT